jgi:hypothetical protein
MRKQAGKKGWDGLVQIKRWKHRTPPEQVGLWKPHIHIDVPNLMGI